MNINIYIHSDNDGFIRRIENSESDKISFNDGDWEILSYNHGYPIYIMYKGSHNIIVQPQTFTGLGCYPIGVNGYIVIVDGVEVYGGEKAARMYENAKNSITSNAINFIGKLGDVDD